MHKTLSNYSHAIICHDVGKDWHATAVSIKDFTLNKSQPTTGSIAKIA